MKLGFAWRLVGATLLRLLGLSWVKRVEEEWNKCPVGLVLFAAGIRVLAKRQVVYLDSLSYALVGFTKFRACWFATFWSCWFCHVARGVGGLH